jgi:hypothetical protein
MTPTTGELHEPSVRLGVQDVRDVAAPSRFFCSRSRHVADV